MAKRLHFHAVEMERPNTGLPNPKGGILIRNRLSGELGDDASVMDGLTS